MNHRLSHIPSKISREFAAQLDEERVRVHLDVLANQCHPERTPTGQDHRERSNVWAVVGAGNTLQVPRVTPRSFVCKGDILHRLAVNMCLKVQPSLLAICPCVEFSLRDVTQNLSGMKPSRFKTSLSNLPSSSCGHVDQVLD